MVRYANNLNNMNPTQPVGKNITSIPTSSIQQNLGGGLVVDNKYGPKTTAAVTDFQTANGLKPDGIFGPLTQTAYDKKFNSSIISTADVHDEAAKNSAALDAALGRYNASYVPPDASNGNYSKTQTSGNNGADPNAPEKDPILSDTISGTANDPIIKQLDAMSVRSNDSTKALIANIQAIRARQGAAIDTQYKNYESGLQLLGIQTNQAQVTPDLLASHISQAETEHLTKISDLDNQEVAALADAENARANNEFKTLEDKMSYVKDIQKQKTQALKEYQDALTTQSDKAQKQGDATAKVIAPDIYTTLQTLDSADQEPFLVSISQKFNVPLTSLVTALVPEKEAADKAAAKKEETDNQLLSPTEAATLGVPYGTTRAEAAKKGITPARYKPTTPKAPSSAASIKEAQNEITNALKTGKDANGNTLGNPRGSDGFVDPTVYIQALNNWPGTQKEFLAKFPVIGTVNPASYSILPAAVQPKKAAGNTKKS